MTHAVIIIKRTSVATESTEATGVSYNYEIPVPHEATPQQVGEMVRKAYKRLESSDD